MAYSTVAQLRENEKELVRTPPIINAIVTQRIAMSDNIVKIDLGNVVDFSAMPEIVDTPATPNYINLCSQYKTVEMCLVYFYSAKRDITEVSDIQYWQKMYDDLVQQIKDGLVDLAGFGTGVVAFQNRAKPDVEPALGGGAYGEFKNLEDLQRDRPIE